MWTLILHISKLCRRLCPDISSTYKQACFKHGLKCFIEDRAIKSIELLGSHATVLV